MTEPTGKAQSVLAFSGRLVPDSFAEFAAHRAARLSLDLEILSCDTTGCRLRLTGPEPLIDAFEMASLLGPYDCVILDVDRGPAATPCLEPNP